MRNIDEPVADRVSMEMSIALWNFLSRESIKSIGRKHYVSLNATDISIFSQYAFGRLIVMIYYYIILLILFVMFVHCKYIKVHIRQYHSRCMMHEGKHCLNRIAKYKPLLCWWARRSVLIHFQFYDTELNGSTLQSLFILIQFAWTISVFHSSHDVK